MLFIMWCMVYQHRSWQDSNNLCLLAKWTTWEWKTGGMLRFIWNRSLRTTLLVHTFILFIHAVVRCHMIA